MVATPRVVVRILRITYDCTSYSQQCTAGSCTYALYEYAYNVVRTTYCTEPEVDDDFLNFRSRGACGVSRRQSGGGGSERTVAEQQKQQQAAAAAAATLP